MHLVTFTECGSNMWLINYWYLCDDKEKYNSTSCENKSINNFKLSKNEELHKKCQLLTVACIVNVDKSATAFIQTHFFKILFN